jgi:chromosome partitioning protein
MKTISFINQKGGVGKTTLCANIGYGLEFVGSVGIPFIYVDADPQGSLRDWHNSEHNDNRSQLVIADTRQSLLSAHRVAQQANYEYMLIDTPGKIAEITGAALTLSDYVIIPIQPSALDVWATIDSIDLVRAAMSAKPSLKACFVINRAIKNSKLNMELLGAIADADPEGSIPVCQTIIHGRVIYARSMNEGQTVFEHPDEQAETEITELTQFIYNELHNE